MFGIVCQVVNSLSRREESWEKKLSAWLSVRRVKRTFSIGNIKLSFLVLSVGRVMVGGMGGKMPPPPTGVKGTHIRGQKNIFLKKSIFCFGSQKKCSQSERTIL